MSDEYRSLKKKIKKKIKKASKKKGGSNVLVLSIGGGLACGGLLLLGIGSALSGKAQLALLLVGIFLFLGGAGLCVLQALPMLGFGPTRLLFKEDCVQLRMGKRTIVGEIPYSNIATAELTYVEDAMGTPCQGVAIMLYKQESRDTWWPHTICEDRQYDIVILDRYNKPMSAVLREVLDGVDRYLQRKTGRLRDTGI